MKRVLIVGQYSYIGESFKKWIERFPEKYMVDIVASINGEWKERDFTGFDVVVDFAGIAHINKITEDMRERFFSVNRDLSIEIAKWAKEKGVGQFIFLSSMNVYGDYCGFISDINDTKPSGFYGESKLEGDAGVRALEDEGFAVSVLRPPFVYGKNCTGNYNRVRKIAKKMPFFPSYKNKKSMIYIDNLCEFIRLLIDHEAQGIFIPQNRELVSTADLVKQIAAVHGKKIWISPIFNWLIRPLTKHSRFFQKAFADDSCSLAISEYFHNDYCVVSFEESIERTENEA